jgi:hypothetical protein
MIIRCKNNEEPLAPKFPIKIKVNWWDPQSEMILMDNEEWFRKPVSLLRTDDPKLDAIKASIPKWQAMARKIDNDPNEDENFCPIKRASVGVYIFSGMYRIGTEIIDVGNEYTKDWLFERIEWDIEKDLYSVGAVYVRYNGMVD